MTTLHDIRAAQQVIAGRLHRTPIMGSTFLGQQVGVTLLFKLELFQKTGSFKPRGVLNKLHHLCQEEKERGVITLSSGNHAQALAYAATLSGIRSTVVMPAWSTQSKVDATKGYGGEVIFTEGDLLQTCLRIQQERNLTLVHPFDDPLIIAGAGTVGLEIMEDVPQIDAVIVGVGGGGLISGVAAAIKLQKPQTRIIGVEPVGASAMTQSLQKGEPVHLSSVNTVADGLAAPFAGKHTLAHVQQYVDEMVLVSDAEIIEAMGMILERCKVIAEPAAASTLAALLFQKISIPAGATVVCVLSGSNIDRQRLKALL
jgi:threonine dehydratase